jgi:UDP-N-acetylglucosamine acyltransferase
MTSLIHPSAFVHPHAQLDDGVSVGPWCLVDSGVVLGEGVTLESRVHVYGGSKIGARTRVFDGAIIGADPQDLKYQGEASRLEIGEDCLIREYCTVNRGTGEGGLTVLGNRVLLMAYVHIAHDCHLGEGAVLANQVQLGGHVQIGEFATIGGKAAVQQFTRIGAYSFIGGTLKIERDLPPASRALGNPVRWAGLNLHALRRHGFSAERIANIEAHYRMLFRSGLTLEDAVRQVLEGAGCDPLIRDYFKEWKGGLVRPSAESRALEE